MRAAFAPCTARGRMAAIAAAFMLAPSLAFAQTLDLAGTYGNEAGCKVARGEEKAAAEALVVRTDRFESAALVCEFVEVLKAADGTRVITALCDIEGEEGRSVSLFTVAPSKTDPTALQIRDEYGAPWDEVKPCG
jgi:hypothetical protein